MTNTNTKSRTHTRFSRWLCCLAILLGLWTNNANAQVNMTRTTFTGSYASISGTSAASAVADNGNFAATIPFTFNYLGVNYTACNINSNGYINFGTAVATNTNSALFTTTTPQAIVAPWFDDMFPTSVQFLTTGSAPNQVFTVQWVGPTYWSGATRTASYQVKLYETTNIIEFWYGTPSGALTLASTSESASIGLENLTGGPGNFLDAVSGSNQIGSGTLNSGQWPTIQYRFTPGAPTALAGGTYNVGTGQTYPTLTEAVADINHRGISGAVVLNLTDATYTDKTAGGNETYPITFATVAGTSAVNTITITGNGADLRYAGSVSGTWNNGSALGTMFGNTSEPILGVCGTDYLNINNIKLTALTAVAFGSNTGTPTRVDRGLAVQTSGAVNGSTFNNFTGLTITLDRNNTNTMAIDQGTSTSPTSVAGANSNNVYKNLTIKNTQKGISLGGNATFPDLACEIGTTSCTTFNIIGDPATPNDIGNTTSSTYGIQVTNLSGVRIYNNIVRNVTASAAQVDGIFIVTAQGTSEVYNNKVQTIKNSSTSSTTGISGIAASHTTTGTHQIRIYNNSVSEILTSYTGAATATRVARGIWIRGTGGATTQTYEIWNNNVSINGTGNLNASNACFEISTTSGPVFNVRNNIFANYTPAQGATAKHSGLFSTAAASFGNTGTTYQTNNIYISTDAGTSGFTANGNATTYNGVTAWQTAVAQATLNLEIDPSYVNTASDLHATAAGLNGTGQLPPAYITVDLDCALRTPDNDLGAYKIDGCGSANGGTASFTGGATVCAGLTKTMSSTGATAPAAGLSYQWEVSATGGGVGFANVSGGSGATTTSYTTGALTAGIYYYRLNVTCSTGPVTAYSNEIMLTVNAAPTVAVSPTSASICMPGGSGVSLTASGATTYSWSPATGLTPNSTSNPVTALPSLTTIYTVTGTDGNGCTATATATVTVAPSITAVASATPATVCSGNNSQLNVAVTPTPGAGAIKITEVCLNRGGTGGGVYPGFAPGADLVEVTNVSSTAVNITGWTLSDHATNTAAATHTGFAFPSGTIIPANSVAVICFGTGTDDIANRYYNTGGTSDFWLSSGVVGFVLKNGSTVVDAVGCGSGYVFNAGTGVTAGDWSGFAPSASGLAGTTRTAANDNNIGADWVGASAGSPQTIGVYNAGFTPPINIASYAWTPSTYISGQESLQNPLATAVAATQAYSVLVTTTDGCTATSNTTVTVTPLSCSPATFTSPNCAFTNFTVTANHAGGGAPYSYSWNDGNGGIYPDAATITANMAAGTYTFVCTVSDGCGANCTSSVTVTVNALPTVTASPFTGLICNPGGSAVTITASGASTYAWSPTAGLTPTSGSPVSANPTASTTYTVVGTDINGCTNSANSIITVAAAVTGATASASANPVCSGAPFNLTSSASQVNTIISQGFESGAAGWSFLDSSSAGSNLPQQLWHIQASPYTDATGSAQFLNFSVSGNAFAYSNSDAGGSGSQTRTFMLSPSFSTVGYTGTGTLTFKQGYRYWSSSSPVEQVKVQITSNGGATWTDLVDYVTVTNSAIVGVTTNNAQTTASVSVTVPAPFMGQSSVQLRWRYLSNWGYYWIVDDIALTGNYTALSYSWSSSPSGFTSGVQNPTGVTQTVNTDYSVLITGTGGCTATASTGVVNTNTPPSVNLTPTQSCIGQNNGTITTSISGGASPYNCTWNGPTFNVVVVPKTAAHPYFGVGSGNGYEIDGVEGKELTLVRGVTYTFSINNPGHPFYISTDANGAGAGEWLTGVTGSQTDFGILTFTPDVTAPSVLYYQCYNHLNMGWKINIVNGLINCNLTNLMPGNYSVVVTDANGCTGIGTSTVTEPASAVTAICSSTPVSCNGGSDGTASVTAGGGTPGYTYLWNTSATTASISGLTAGTYTVTVTDANGCTAMCTSTVSEPTALTATCSSTPVSCNGGSNGTASVTAGGGTPGYTYLWNTSATTASISGLTAGTYTVTVTDANGCITVCTSTVSEPTVLTATCSSTPVSCNGGSDGTASVTAGGGTPGYTYLWNTSATTASISGLTAGTYTVTVTDANGCTAMCTSTVTEPTALTATCSSTPVSCPGGSDGTASVTAGGGTPAYTYLWNTSATTASISGLTAGTYTVTVTDANGCVANCTQTIIVIDNQNPVITCPANISVCDPGSPIVNFNVTATDNCSIQSIVSTPASGSTFPPGTTTVTSVATDVSGNTATCSFTVTVSTPSTAPTSATSDAPYNNICTGNSTNLTVNGGSLGTGATWNWYSGSCGGTAVGTGASINVSPTVTTTYFVRAEGACNNTLCASVTITVSSAPVTSLALMPFTGMPAHVCNGTTATISVAAVANATFYVWDAPSGSYFNGNVLNVSPFTTTTPSVTVTFGNPSGSLYNVGVQAGNACGSSIRQSQKVRGLTSVPTSISGSLTACLSSVGTYTTPAVTGATSYLWTITGNATVSGTGTTATVTFGPGWTGGTLCVASQTSCYTSATKCVNITTSAATLGAISGTFTACPNTTITYSVPASAGAASYTWTLPPGATGSSTTNSIAVTFGPGYNAVGSICVSVTSICGVTSAVKCKTVAPGLPSQPASISGPSNGLCGQSVVYTCPSQGVGVTYNWTVPAGASVVSGQGTTSVNVLYGTFSTGNVCVTASNACGSSIARCITVKGAPATPGAITATPSSWCANTPGIQFDVNVTGLSGVYTLSWTYPTSPIATYTLGGGNSTQLVMDWLTGTGNINVTASNACGSGTRTSTWSQTCRQGEVGTVSTLTVSPNPTTGVVNINYTASKGNTVINVLDLAGRVVMTETTTSVDGANNTQLDMSKLAKGAYMLSVQSTQGNKQVRVVVE